MNSHLVFSLVGPDRTGLVDRMTAVIVQHGGNLEDARMSVLGGEFAVIMLVCVEDQRRAALEEDMGALARELGMMAMCKSTAPVRTSAEMAEGMPPPSQVPFIVTVRGMDHEGIVHEVVHALALQGISIENLESRVTLGAFTGTALFSMDLRVLAPAATSLADLRRRLLEAADRLNVDVDLQPEHAEQVV